jgi:hypothetical protein
VRLPVFIMTDTILVGVCVLMTIVALVLKLRNYWVFNRQNELNRFENGVHITKLYASYDTMLVKFWIWNVEKFRLTDTN